MPFSDNVELVAYHDLDGRAGFKLAVEERSGRFFLYVASLWDSGWSVIDVTDPSTPSLLRWVDGPPGTWTIQVQVADGKMITGLEHVPPGWSAKGAEGAEPWDGFLIWDLAEPDAPTQIGHWRSGAKGTHRNFYNGGRYVHAATTLPGFDGHIYGAVDIDDPTSPQLVGKWWWPGQAVGDGEEYTDADRRKVTGGHPHPTSERPGPALSLHGGAYIEGERAYCPWMRAGLVILDVSSPTNPALVSSLSMYPPLGSSIATHTAVPLVDRQLVVVNSEALREDCDEPANYVALVDIRDERDPYIMSLFPSPRAPQGYPNRSFCAHGGRFGPHNQHQPQGMSCLQPSSDLIYLTYFNAGLQIYDISDPHDPRIVGYFIPDDPQERRGPLPKTLVAQAEDVIVDRRGYIYMSEKNSGIYILRHNG